MKFASLSGSLTRLIDDKSYLVAGSNVTITSGSGAQITISANDAYATSTGYLNANYMWATSSLPHIIAGASTFTGVPNVSGTITTSGSPVLIYVNASWFASSSGSPASALTITRNGVNLGNSNYGLSTVGPRAQIGSTMPVWRTWTTHQQVRTPTHMPRVH